MQYLKPELIVVLDLRQFALTQYSTVTEIDPGDEGCPSLVFDEVTGTGTQTLHAEFTVSIDGDCTVGAAAPSISPTSCSASIVMDATAVYEGNVLVVECSSSQLTCDSDCPPPCVNGILDITGGEICLVSATVNGEAVGGAGTCEPLTAVQADALSTISDNCGFGGKE